MKKNPFPFFAAVKQIFCIMIDVPVVDPIHTVVAHIGMELWRKILGTNTGLIDFDLAARRSSWLCGDVSEKFRDPEINQQPTGGDAWGGYYENFL